MKSLMIKCSHKCSNTKIPGQCSIRISDLQLSHSDIAAVHITETDFTHMVGDMIEHFRSLGFKCIDVRLCLRSTGLNT